MLIYIYNGIIINNKNSDVNYYGYSRKVDNKQEKFTQIKAIETREKRSRQIVDPKGMPYFNIVPAI